MKKYAHRSLIIGLLMTSLSAAAQQSLEAQKPVINVGQVVFMNPVSADFEITNKSGKQLKISQVRTSCGCTEATYPHQSIAENAQFSVKATYDAKQMGHFQKQIAVYTDDAAKPLILTMRGVVVEEIMDFAGEYPYQLGDLLVDKNSIEFDDVNRGDMPMAKIHVKNPTEQSVEPVVMHLPNYLRAEVSPSKIAPGHSGLITVLLNSHSLRDYGLTQTVVYLGGFPGDKVDANKMIDVSAVLLPGFNNLTDAQRLLAPDMQISDTILHLGAFDGKKKLNGEIEIKNNGKSTLEIQSLQMYTTGLMVSLDKSKIEPGEDAKLKITAVAKQLRNVKTKPRVLMITNDPDMPKVIIEVEIDN